MTEQASTFGYDPDTNIDEAILAQTREIEKEIAVNQSMIGPSVMLDEIVEDYAKEDSIYRHKVGDLKSRYKKIRKVRGDGNCFFRAFGFAYLERLLNKPQEYDSLLETAGKSKDYLLEQLGYPQYTVEDFFETFVEIVGHVKTPGTVDDLLQVFNDQGFSDYFVVFLRLLVSGELQKNEDEYQHFIDGGRTVKEFCSQEVEPMSKESDHIHIVALSRSLNVSLAVEYMDRDGNKCNRLSFGENESEPALILLYRPGHYDILYNTCQED